MRSYRLIIGNRTFSSWSMRGWLLAALSGVPFEEEMIWLDEPGYKNWLVRRTGGAGTVPTLKVIDTQSERFIPDSMAIAEYFAELAPEKGYWPGDPVDRAEARSLAARMHSGYAALRRGCPMNLSNRFTEFEADAEIIADLKDLDSAWSACLSRDPEGGPYLFGRFGAVDCFFAPVATRAFSFSLRRHFSEISQAYIEAVLDHPLVQEWVEASETEMTVTRERTGRMSEGWYKAGNYPILKRYG